MHMHLCACMQVCYICEHYVHCVAVCMHANVCRHVLRYLLFYGCAYCHVHICMCVDSCMRYEHCVLLYACVRGVYIVLLLIFAYSALLPLLTEALDQAGGIAQAIGSL